MWKGKINQVVFGSLLADGPSNLTKYQKPICQKLHEMLIIKAGQARQLDRHSVRVILGRECKVPRGLHKQALKMMERYGFVRQKGLKIELL